MITYDDTSHVKVRRRFTCPCSDEKCEMSLQRQGSRPSCPNLTSPLRFLTYLTDTTLILHLTTYSHPYLPQTASNSSKKNFSLSQPPGPDQMQP